MFKKVNVLYLLIILALILAACQAPPDTPEPVVETLVVTEAMESTPVETIQVVTPTPEPEGPRMLVIFMGFEPPSIYPYGNDSLAVSEILEAIAEVGGTHSITIPSPTSR